MSFNINETLADMLKAVKTEVGDNWGEVKTVANQFMNNRKTRLALIAELAITGELSAEKIISRLEDEKLIFEAELHAIAVISKAIAQKAANAAIDVLYKAIDASISAIL
ncbi:MAG: hypothetical protein H7Y00_00635 [Fimbriimonadaceae bacterium]|nr:hypothetical protein [Chitinophagales bacterium]